MSEEYARHKQYEYKTNSNLVLTSENRNLHNNEPTGEVETLRGRVSGKMGDKVSYTRPKELDEKIEKAKKRRAKKDKEAQEAPLKKKKTSILNAAENDGLYKPKTKETRAAYEQLLSFIKGFFGDQPQDILRGAADEVLAIMKNDHTKAPEKKKEVESVLDRADIASDRFADLTAIAKQITDYTDEGAAGGDDTLDAELGVAVVFDSDSDDSDEFELRGESDDEDDEDKQNGEVAENGDVVLQSEGMDDSSASANSQFDIDAREIDAFWLQRKISAFESDPEASQALAEKVLEILQARDSIWIENELVPLLDYERFDFIKLLVRNRKKVVFCTRLEKAQTPEEKKQIEAEMRDDPEGESILAELKSSKKGKDAAAAVKKEPKAAKIKVEIGNNVVIQNKTAKGLLNLDDLSFTQGGHLMSNKHCKLPEGSFRKQKKGYEEVYVPGLKPPAFEQNEKLVAIPELPEWARPAFKNMTTLNRVQSRLYKTAFFGADNFLLCAPTGAGKTNVAMLAFLHEIGKNYDKETGELNKDNFKIVYIAPMKSLVQEMVNNFSQRLEPFGITVRELSGDQSLTKKQISETQIIVTTPEKWDIITRKSGDRTYTQLVRLVVIDEIHLLHDDRGPVLESIVTRTLRQIEATQVMVRLVGLSATLPNYEDVGTFLRVKPEHIFTFNNSYRPVPLQQQYIGITEKKALKRFQIMNEITYEKVMERAGNSQVLIFVHSRKETIKTARAIREMALANDTLGKFLPDNAASKEILQTEANSISSLDLKEILPYGFAIHHAGMTRADRTLVEELYADRHIQVLVSTATLAWGVNLPAHTVIIKGTQIYNPEKGRWTELSPLDIMQMLGRAGRPAYDKEGEGIVITSHAELQYYLSLNNMQLPIESQFISKLADHLNAEIVLGTIQNLRDAVTWLGYTYLYVCMLRTPSLYGVSADEAEADRVLLQRRIDLVHTAATLLDKHSLIKYDRKSGNFQVTDLGRVAAHYYISYQSMATYHEHLKPNIGDIEVFRLFSLSTEFKFITVREEEKSEMEKLLERVPIPIKESIEEPSAKVNVLLQAYISRFKLEGFALVSDMVYITQSAARIMRALFEIALKRGWAQLAVKLLTVSKMVERRMWSSQTPLRQFKDIPEDILKKLEKKDFPMERLHDLTSQEIGELINFPQQGKPIYHHVHQFPRLALEAHVQPITRSVLRVELTITPDFEFGEKYHGSSIGWYVLVEDVDSEVLLHHEYFILKKKFAEEEHTVSFTVPLFEPLPPNYFIRVVADRWLNAEAVLPVSFRHLILPEKYPPHTELLDLQPLPINALGSKDLEQLYKNETFKYFNPIQTQVFPSLFESDENVLVCAPTGSGKTICAEFALFRLLTSSNPGKCVYVAPIQAIATERLRDWQEKFGNKLGKRLSDLTGDSPTDIKLMEKTDIIVTTAEKWDIFSRRWKGRKSVQNVRLFIVDELHLIGGDKGPIVEVVVSRMRYIASQTGNAIRIVGLSTSLANAKDLGEWLGTTSHSLFNFHPNVRPVPLEIHIQGFDIPHFNARMLAMTKPAIYAVAHQAGDKPVIVFVPTRKQARTTSRDILTFVDSEEDAKRRRFLRCAVDDLAPHLANVESKALQESLSFGVGYYHDGLTPVEKKVVETLYATGAIQVIVVTADQCWGLPASISAHLVVIMGTQYYQGHEQRYGDYPITDILQMMGRAGRPDKDDSGKCVILCHAPKKDYYKKFLYEPLPIESHLDHSLADHMNSEVVTKTIANKQDAIDYLTWTFLYRRFTQNPNYYNLTGVSHRHLSDHMSELIENTLSDLEKAKCITVEDEMDLAALNCGVIASHYYITYTTVELFNASLTATTKRKGIIEILCSATEYSTLPVRQREDSQLFNLAKYLPLKIDKAKYTDPHTKANVLLQAHFSRKPLSADLHQDQQYVVENATRMIHAIVDVLGTNGWLQPALAAMELSQMVTQAVWDSDSDLKQIPHITEDAIARCKDKGVESVFDLMDLESDAREQLLQMTPKQLADAAVFCNRFPDITVTVNVANKDNIRAGSKVTIDITLEREDDEVGLVYAPRYPKEKTEGWWVLIGDQKTNHLVTSVRAKTAAKLEFTAPGVGTHDYQVYLMSDSYSGCDQDEFHLKLNVKAAQVDADR